MIMDARDGDDRQRTLRGILDLSWRLSDSAPPMKPFLRFSKVADTLYRGKPKRDQQRFWDFDDALQKVLLGMSHAVATPEEIAEACIDRWKTNLKEFGRRSKAQLEELRKRHAVPGFTYTPRSEFILSRVPPGGRLLYVGCGAGADCLGWAQRGYQIVGIDTDEELVSVANEWAAYLGLPFEAVCMDAHNITLAPGPFDGFLLEFYGFQPSRAQALSLQRGLAAVLNENGRGFIVATRKKYPSFWFRMSTLGYPPSMLQWLAGQHRLDHCLSQGDACEEKLAFGLYIRSHTVDSLSRELAGIFDVQECRYEEYDPRYLISVVKRKGSPSASPAAWEHDDGEEWTRQECRPMDRASMEGALGDIRAICDRLELHRDNVERFFLQHEGVAGKNPLASVDTDLPHLVGLLERVYAWLPCLARESPGLPVEVG